MTQRIATIEVEKTRTLADAIVDTVREPLVVLDRDLRVRHGEPLFLPDVRRRCPRHGGRPFYELADGQWDIPALRQLLEEVISRSSHDRGL